MLCVPTSDDIIPYFPNSVFITIPPYPSLVGIVKTFSPFTILVLSVVNPIDSNSSSVNCFPSYFSTFTPFLSKYFLSSVVNVIYPDLSLSTYLYFSYPNPANNGSTILFDLPFSIRYIPHFPAFFIGTNLSKNIFPCSSEIRTLPSLSISPYFLFLATLYIPFSPRYISIFSYLSNLIICFLSTIFVIPILYTDSLPIVSFLATYIFLLFCAYLKSSYCNAISFLNPCPLESTPYIPYLFSAFNTTKYPVYNSSSVLVIICK